MAFEYEIVPKSENERLTEGILKKLGIIVNVSLNPLDGKVHVQSEDELSPEQLEAIKEVLNESGRG